MLPALTQISRKSNSLGPRLFHTSSVQCGRKNRNRTRKDFFAPRERYFQQLENMYNQGYKDDLASTVGSVVHQFITPNYPMGDLYLRDRKEVITYSDKVSRRYYKEYPEERLSILRRKRPADIQWYKQPFERFLEKLQTLTKAGMPYEQAWKECKDEKVLEQEVVSIEFMLCKQQAEALFSIPEIDWVREFTGTTPESVLEEQSKIDPRVQEKLEREKVEHLDNLVQQCANDSQRRKILAEEAGLPYKEIIEYIIKNPDSREHFDESVYFDGMKEHLEPRSLHASLRESGKPADDENTMLEDLDFQTGKWAKDLMSYFYDQSSFTSEMNKEERSQLSEQAISASLERALTAQDLKSYGQDLQNTMSFEDLEQKQFKSTADESVRESKKRSPYISGGLASELNSLFGDINKKSK
eukprot:TRINITY_DN3417_c0_g1_i1.p1 TRINITY_DN3417_c0_g1~~TRINITY_DN3417_c0_g1_i1.p1  ORF type:complete len:413 (+),score=108.74 TRINITY_DN3417_c0_g1_i1:72-1310(+)